MFVTRHIPTDHQDLIHDVSYDFHGRRMATCSTDQTVQIWDLQDNGEWKCTASWKSHSGSVWRVTWAHPEFGQVIATCSFDRTVSVWEECVGDTGRDGVQSNWIRKTSHVDSRTSIMDVKFAPKHLGLLLATCSADGIVRIYEAPDVMNLSQWSLQHEIMCKISCSCISWNPSRMHAPMIAVGSDDPSPSAGGKCQIYEFNSANRKWNKVESLSVVTDPVHDVAFAPNLGRSHHLLAIASKDLKIISLTPYGRDAASTTQGSKFKMQQVADFSEHESQVWRLSWNVTGTILCSSGDDGCVRLWKANYLGSWKCIAVLKGDGSQVQQMDINQSSMSSSGGQGQSNSGVRGPPAGVMNMNIKRNSGWPLFNTQKDQGKAYY